MGFQIVTMFVKFVRGNLEVQADLLGCQQNSCRVDTKDSGLRKARIEVTISSKIQIFVFHYSQSPSVY